MNIPSDFSQQRNSARAAAACIEGWLNEAQGEALFEAAAHATGRGHIVEIGSWLGRSTVWLAYGARVAGQRVLAVDRHVGSREDPTSHTFETFMTNIRRAGVADVVTPLVMSSADAARHVEGGVEVLFVDGDHSDEGARADVAAWLPRLVDGGCVLMHDVVTASYTGPRRQFRQRICWSGEFSAIHRVGSMGVATKVSQRGMGAAAWSWCAGVLLYVVDVKRWLRKARGR